VPTVAAFIELIGPTFTPRTAATYRPYWRLAVERLGDRRLDDVGLADLAAVVADAVDRAKRNRPTSSGRASRETCISALRALFARAAASGLIVANPAAVLTKPRRARSRRRALDDHELAELIGAVRTTSRDPDLDLLVVRFHLETGARRQGALGLRRRDLDALRSTVWLQEKGDSEREQPVSPSLVALLARHVAARASSDRDDGAVFRTSLGAPMSARRYDTIFRRARVGLDWSHRIPVSAHVLRHTAITAVGRLAGYPVAQAFAGPRHHRSPAATYTPASPRSPPPSPPSPANRTHSPMVRADSRAPPGAGSAADERPWMPPRRHDRHVHKPALRDTLARRSVRAGVVARRRQSGSYAVTALR
jgi:integrase